MKNFISFFKRNYVNSCENQLLANIEHGKNRTSNRILPVLPTLANLVAQGKNWQNANISEVEMQSYM